MYILTKDSRSPKSLELLFVSMQVSIVLKIIIKDCKGDLIQFTEQRFLYLRIGRLIVILRLKK